MMLAEFVYLSFFPGTNMSWILIVSLASCPLSLPYMLIGTKSCNNNLIGYLEEKKKIQKFLSITVKLGNDIGVYYCRI